MTTVAFTGVDVDSDTKTMSFTFDKNVLPSPTFRYDKAKKTLTFYVTSDMTLKPGHKVIVLNAQKSKTDGTKTAAQVLLPFDVTRR